MSGPPRGIALISITLTLVRGILDLSQESLFAQLTLPSGRWTVNVPFIENFADKLFAEILVVILTLDIERMRSATGHPISDKRKRAAARPAVRV
jgi:hypothetical protein